MIFNLPNQHLVSLVRELCRLPQETEWVEFKVNNDEPREIGEYISALANSATLAGKAKGYLVWGVRRECSGGCLIKDRLKLAWR
jgi:ATP-dependent DNA helicase RecG